MTRRSALLSACPLLPPLLRPALAASPDPDEILHRAVQHDDANFERLRHYVFTVIDHAYHREKAVEGQSFEVNLISGEMYWRTLTQSFLPLSADQATIERERLRRHLRAARVDRTIWRQERRLLEALPLTHDVRHQGRQTLNSRACHVLELKPRRSPLGDAGFLQYAQMRLHIDQEEFHWARAEFAFPQAVGFHLRQLLLGRLSLPYSNGLINNPSYPPRTRLTFELARNDEGLWHPLTYVARFAPFRSELLFQDFRRFTSESTLVFGEV